MEVHLTPELQAQIDRLVIETGLPAEKLIEDALAEYVSELAQMRGTLDSRYDDLKSGRVKPIPGDELMAHFRARSAAARRTPNGS
jgi:hypothetical protein